jgi:hypothetical protein
MKQFIRLAIILPFLLGSLLQSRGQELEPRNLTNLPIGINFFSAGYAHASGNTLLDPSLPLEDFNGRINSIIVAYVRSVNFWGKSGKVGVILPFAGGDFEGVFDDEPFTDAYTGFGDIRLRASVNLSGAPALMPKDYGDYEQDWVSGFGIQITAPTGKYNPVQLPNLGTNRWTFRFNYGVSKTVKDWIFELYAGIWIFTPNDEFLEDFRLTQDPLWVAKTSIIRSLGSRGNWLAFSMGYGYGAQSAIDGIDRDAIISQMPLSIIYAHTLGKKHSVKLALASGIRFKQGADFDAFAISYQFRWLDQGVRPKKQME